MENDVISAARSFGASDVALALVDDGPRGLPFAVSIVVRLSDAIIDEIEDRPTYTYFNHYRSVNYCIDQILLHTVFGSRNAEGDILPLPLRKAAPTPPSNPVFRTKRQPVSPVSA